MAEQEEPTLSFNLGGQIGDKITEAVKNMDIVSVLQKMLDVPPEDEQSEEIRDKLQGVLKQLDVMDDEQKANLIAQIKDRLVKKLNDRLNDPNMQLTGIEEAIKNEIMSKLYMVAAGAIILLILFVFFGYKLYKSLRDKEKKKEEKKKAKEMKKKK